MNIYSRKQNLKLALFVGAVLVAVAVFWYSSNLVKKLSRQERDRIEMWAKAVSEIQNVPSETLFTILESNSTIPVILTDSTDNVLQFRNLNERKSHNPDFVKESLKRMKEIHPPIVIELPDNMQQFVYYDDSVLLTSLFYYPFVQIGVTALFILVSYLAFSSSRRAEENQVWVGMSKETAHQLGTPISSLVAWVEMMKLRDEDSKLIAEVSKDVKRLETITERFSKIGSEPVLQPVDISTMIAGAVDYLKLRTSGKVTYYTELFESQVLVPMNITLFEWVIENLCKNAIDAMNGKGSILIVLTDKVEKVFIDITDTGKGIPKHLQKTVFKPGFTTKKRGWGLGLSLAKRIVETYHQGKIFVKNSETEKGTTFRIILKK